MNRRWVLRIALALLGLLLFSAFVLRAGLDDLLQALKPLGWSASALLLPYLLVYYFDTLGWAFAFPNRPGGGLKLPTLFRIRWIGEAVNNAVVQVGGEALKVLLLGRLGVDRSEATAAIVLSKTLQSLAQVLVLALGALLATQVLAEDSPLRIAMFAVAGCGLLALSLAAAIQWYGAFATATRLLRGLGLKSANDWLKKAEELDSLIRESYQRRFFATLASAAFYTIGWLVGALEISALAWLLGQPIGLAQAIAVEAFIGLFKALGFFVPGALGVQESGILSLGEALQVPRELALAYAIIRRGREMTYALIGGLLLSLESARHAAAEMPSSAGEDSSSMNADPDPDSPSDAEGRSIDAVDPAPQPP